MFLKPPGLKNDVTEVLKKAFSRVIQSDKWLVRAQNSKRSIMYRAGAEIASLMGESVETLTRFENINNAKLKQHLEHAALGRRPVSGRLPR